MSSINSFEDLEVWKIGTEIRKLSMNIVRKLPPEEKFDLGSQLKRAARSINSNIAEGYGRFHYQENIQFCRVSRGSAYETLDHFIVANEEAYISEKELQNARELIDKFLRVVNGYINYLKKAKDNQ
ncbi:MAG: four helix bundle protein [Cyclobacteriaceae bacterium]|nr:four helix bundle protein [Cyclobacteriaceae bacterium]